MKDFAFEESIERRLAEITPGQILSLFQVYFIQLIVITEKPEEKDNGILSCISKRQWFITIGSKGREGNLDTMLHELFHLVLIRDDLDDPYGDQKFDDEIIEEAVRAFSMRCPNFAQQLWNHFKSSKLVISP